MHKLHTAVIALAIALTGLLTGCTPATVNGLPDSNVYRMTRTGSGELLVTCLNGADATIRPTAGFGSIVISCGK
jgi:hypothetical protein